MAIRQSNLAIVVISMFIFTVLQCSQAIQTPDLKQAKQKDIYKRSIVFDIKTPKVFYCPQEKQADFGKMIVKAKPLDKLCEFEGKVKPKSTPSDCYNDLDETDYACDEKRRFMLRLESLTETEEKSTATINYGQDSLDAFDYIVTKELNKKKLTNKKL